MEGYCSRCSEYLRRFFSKKICCCPPPLTVKPGKAPIRDSICPELLIHAVPGLKFWLRGFLSSGLLLLKIPKVWRRALAVAIPKFSKPVEDLQSYRPISLLCVPYKILKRLIYNRVKPIVDRPLISKEQGGFQQGKSTVDQIIDDLLKKKQGWCRVCRSDNCL